VPVKRQGTARRASAAPSKGAIAAGASNTRAFSTPRQWAAWLSRHHATSHGIWLRFFKKDSGVRSITYAEALEEALCWGWIDGQARSGDERSWLQRWTPRRPRSAWSKRNCERVERLERDGRMRPAGRAEVDAARADGRWQRAYDSPAASEIPADFLAALAGHPRALEFFRTLNRANVYAIGYRLQTAKRPETRQRRLEQILQMMKDGRRFY
jgi:uncharacterized protein YdeI (YjbR/CyaY-like superfamily)